MKPGTSLSDLVEFETIRDALRDYSITTAPEFVSWIHACGDPALITNAFSISNEELMRLYGAAYNTLTPDEQQEYTRIPDEKFYTGHDVP